MSEFNAEKKKKKKSAFKFDDVEEALPAISSPADGIAEVAELDFGKKKKKRHAPIASEDKLDSSLYDKDSKDENVDVKEVFSGYSYDELLNRCLRRMLADGKDAKGDSKLCLETPMAARVGTKKTMLSNFHRLCEQINRPSNHVMAYLFAEMGTTGSLDASNQLLLKGRFSVKQFENVLRNYSREYVLCHTCRSKNTKLEKGDRIFFVQCQQCGSRTSVTSIKSGFQAVTSKRAALRAKTTN